MNGRHNDFDEQEPGMLTISQLAAYTGVTVRTVRHYHAKGLLPEPERQKALVPPDDDDE